MIKLLGKYSGLVQVIMIIIGVTAAFQLYGYKLDNIAKSIEDVTNDYAGYKDWSKDNRLKTRESEEKLIMKVVDNQKKIITAINIHSLHQKYLIEAVKNQTESNNKIHVSLGRLNNLLAGVKSSGYIEISKKR